MKKTYMAPRMEQMTMDSELPLCASSGVVGGGSDIDIDIPFGGVDVEGILNPSTKTRFDFDNWFNF
ncbi:MAG: hypothetical protein K2O61_04515 [Bacteroidaceae bacterium]|nr:hypothetical protein [Bacteroidaceae bacterium]